MSDQQMKERGCSPNPGSNRVALFVMHSLLNLCQPEEPVVSVGPDRMELAALDKTGDILPGAIQQLLDFGRIHDPHGYEAIEVIQPQRYFFPER